MRIAAILRCRRERVARMSRLAASAAMDAVRMANSWMSRPYTKHGLCRIVRHA